MFIRISRLIICVAICITALPSIARAQETPLPSNVVTATPEWQSKGDITVSGMKAKGNTQGSNLSIAFTNTLQHKQLLSETAMTLNRMNLTTQTMGAMVYNIYTLSTKVGHDVSKNLRASVGVEALHNTLMMVDHGTTVYVEARQALLSGQTHALTVGAGLGYSWYAFDQTSADLRVASPASTKTNYSPSSPAWRMTGNYRLSLPNKIVFSHDVSYTDYVANGAGHSYTLGTSLDCPLTKHVSFVPAYRITEVLFSNTVIDQLGVFPRDSTFTLGAKVTF